MKDKVKAMYDDVTMPVGCMERILEAAERKKERKRRPMLRPVLAMAAVLALVVCLAPPVRAAVENLVIKFFNPDTGLSVYQGETSQGETVTEVHYDTEAEAFAEVREGRLYFTGNGEDVDVTDAVQDGKPYIYTYEEADGRTGYMIVGMAGSIENFGIYTFIREADGTWFTGAGRNNVDPETEQAYPWVENLWQELNIPWPMPGK